MMERKAFPANQRHQDFVSQYGEDDYGASNKNDGDYYECLSLSHFTNEL